MWYYPALNITEKVLVFSLSYDPYTFYFLQIKYRLFYAYSFNNEPIIQVNYLVVDCLSRGCFILSASK